MKEQEQKMKEQELLKLEYAIQMTEKIKLVTAKILDALTDIRKLDPEINSLQDARYLANKAMKEAERIMKSER